MPIVAGSGTPQRDRDEWRTPKALFKLFDYEFHFQLDAAATKESNLCPLFYSKEDNALERPWYIPEKGIGRVWLNPPYSQTEKFLVKANQEARRGALVACLVRADAPETKWWTSNVLSDREHLAHEIRYLVPRVSHISPGGTETRGSTFPSCVIIMKPYHVWSKCRWVWWKRDAALLGIEV